MRKRQFVLSGLVSLLIIGSSAFAFDALGEQVLPSDDAYHYGDFADGQHDGSYVEWWYFNLFAEDIQVIFSYAIIDPENYTDLGMAAVGAVAYTPQGVVNESDFFSTDTFSASYDQADVQIESNAIEVIDSDTYRIVGSIGDGQLVIKGEKKERSESHEKGRHLMERHYGSVYRMLSLPEDVDEASIEATYDKGVLSITMKKVEVKKKATKNVKIKTG